MAELCADTQAQTSPKNIAYLFAAPARLSGFTPFRLIDRPAHTFTNPLVR
jgi:hypothetical protein